MPNAPPVTPNDRYLAIKLAVGVDNAPPLNFFKGLCDLPELENSSADQETDDQSSIDQEAAKVAWLIRKLEIESIRS